MDRRNWTLLLILGAIWGSSYMFISIGLREFSPAMVVFVRVVLGAAVLVPIALRRGALAGARPFFALLVVLAGIQMVGPFLLIAEGQQQITSSLAGVLVGTVPIFGAILAVFFDQEERSDGLRGVGVLTGMVGVALLFGVDLSGSTALLIGGTAVVAASIGYAAGGLVVKKKLGPMPSIGVAASVLTLSSVLVAPYAIATAPSELPSLGPVAALLALGLLGTGVAFAIFYDLLTVVGPSRTFIVTYLAPGFAVLYGALLLDEPIGIGTVAGLALILAGSYLAVQGRLPWARGAALSGP